VSFGRGPDAEKFAKERPSGSTPSASSSAGPAEDLVGDAPATYAASGCATSSSPTRPGHRRKLSAAPRGPRAPELGALALSDIKAHVIKAFIAKKLRRRGRRARNLSGSRRRRKVTRSTSGRHRPARATRAQHGRGPPDDPQSRGRRRAARHKPRAKFGKTVLRGEAASRGIHVEIYEEPEASR